MAGNLSRTGDGVSTLRAQRPFENEFQVPLPAPRPFEATQRGRDVNDLDFAITDRTEPPRRVTVRAHGGNGQLSGETRTAAEFVLSKLGRLFRKFGAVFVALFVAAIALPVSAVLVLVTLAARLMVDEDHRHPVGGIRGGLDRQMDSFARLPITAFMRTYSGLIR
ncbi:hypothetical protein [Variovorax saccharolyticus]|uniref:hypothetical protein n=1 Tax=Variovorax saccharolyticus TaxID=3053516 RepID=UPI002576E2DA|nr:hypothetical protein [Variovorax sp. J31P216]MDM0030495.1 hypothetical protein [Variovorax sp. J31P216]